MDHQENHPHSQEPSTAPTGLKAEVSSFFKEASAYLQLRSELFTIEAKEAGQVYGKKSSLVLLSAGLLLISYLLLLAALIGILAAALDPEQTLTLANWTGASLILAALHLILGFLLFKKAKKIGQDQRFFEYTRNELQKEQEWLKHKKKR